MNALIADVFGDFDYNQDWQFEFADAWLAMRGNNEATDVSSLFPDGAAHVWCGDFLVGNDVWRLHGHRSDNTVIGRKVNVRLWVSVDGGEPASTAAVWDGASWANEHRTEAEIIAAWTPPSLVGRCEVKFIVEPA